MKALQFTIPVVPDKTVILQEDNAPQFYPYLHRHKEAQLIWILKGQGTLIVDNSMHSFKPNDIFMIAPNQSHVFKASLRKDDDKKKNLIHTISIFYDPKGIFAHILQLPELSQLNSFLQEYLGGFKLPKTYFDTVSTQIKKIKESNDIDQVMHFLHLLRIFCKMSPKPDHLSCPITHKITEGEGLRMGNIYNYILKHYQQDVKLEEIAEEAHLTPQAFCRYFKKRTGVTFITFLNEMRVNEACKKLTQGEYDSISTVAYNCGFNSITNFNRVFKSIAGCAPKEYLSRYLSTVK